MAELSKQEKEARLKQWRTAQNRQYILSKAKVQKLFYYLETQLGKTPCNHTLRHTVQWLNNNLPQEKVKSAIKEMKEMGGYCDCEVLMNCYERYDIS